MRKTIKKLVILWAFLPVFMIMNTVFAASGTPLGGSNGQAVLTIDAYNCSSYVTDESSASKITSGLNRCVSAARNGTIPTLKLNDGDTIDAGKYIVVVTKFDSDTPDLVRILNYSLNYNNDALEVLKFGNAFGTTNTQDYPYDSEYVWDDEAGEEKLVRTNKYTISFSNPARSELNNTKQITALMSTMSSDSSFGLNQHQNLAYHAFKVKDDAPGGATLAFNFGEQPKYTDASKVMASNTRIYLNQSPLSIKVSGGTTSSDNSLKQIQVSYNGTLFDFDSTTPFSPGVKTTDNTYLFYVGDGAADIDFNIIANDSNAAITSATLNDLNSALDKFDTEDNQLQFGTNTFVFTVTAADGQVETHTINVYRLSNDASVTNITADGITLNKESDNKTYTGLTTYADTDTTIYVTPTHQNATTTSGAGSWTFTSSGATVNKRNVVVSAENCKSEYMSIGENTCATKTYTINITRTNASQNANLSDLSYGYNGASVSTVGGFNKTTYSYNLGNVPYNTNSITIAGLVDDTGKATIISGTGDFNIAVGANTFEIKVRAEDGTTVNTYKLNVYRYSNDDTIDTFSVTSNPAGTLTPAFTKSFTGTYKYGYDPTVSTVTVSVTVHDIGKAKVAIVDSTSGQPTSYSSSLNTATQTFNVPATTDVSVIVTNENGDVRIYPITLERQKSNDNYLANLKVEYEKDGTKVAPLSPTFGAATRSYTVTIPADVDTVNITPTKASTYATVRKIGDTTGTDLTNATVSNLQFGNNSAQIVVYSEAGVDNPYTLTIVRKKYDIATLDALSLGNGSFTTAFNKNTTAYTYDGTIPYNQNTITINGTKTNSYASVQVSVTDEKNNTQSQTINEGDNNSFSGTLNLPTGTSTVGVLVTAHDNTTKTYTITIKRAKNNDSTVSNLRVDGQVETPTYDDSTKTYTVTVPFNTVTITPGQVAVTPTDSNAQVSKGSSVTGLTTTTYKDFTFRVTAEDSTYTDYTVKIIKKKNSVGILTRETVKVGTNNYYCDVDQNTKSCTISVPVLTENFTIVSTISENATVMPVNNTNYSMPSTESEKELTITVTSEDGTDVNIYTITVERARSSDNSLSDLQVDGTTINGFTTSGNSFSDTEGGSTSSVSLRAIVNDVGKAFVKTATVNGIEVSVTGDISTGNYTFDAPLNYGTNNVVITVEAENGQRQNFNISITRQQNVTATIKELYYGVGSNAPVKLNDWNKDGSTYTLSTVDYDTTSITLIAHSEDETYGTAQVTKVVDEKNATRFTNMPNETTETGKYKVTIPLSTGTNTITLVGYAHNTTITKTYTLTVVRTKNGDNSVSDLKVKGYAVTDDGNKTYSVTLPNNIDSIVESDVTYTLPTGATASVSPATLSLSTTGNNVATLTVTSEGGSAEIYTINITRTKSSNADLTKVSLKIVSSDPDYNGRDYYCNFDSTTAVSCTIDVPQSTTAYTITSTVADNTATVNPANGTSDTMSATESTKVIPIVVTAEDNTKKDYSVTVRRAKSSNTNLAYLRINGISVPNFTPSGVIYRVDVDGDTEEVTVETAVEDAGRATILEDFSEALPVQFGLGTDNDIKITVEAENGNTREVHVYVTRKPRQDASLKEIKIDGVALDGYDIVPETFSSGVTEYTITTPFDYSKTSVNVTGVVNDPDLNAHITSGTGNTSLTTGTNIITLHVVAHDTNYYKDYKITLTRNKNSDTSLSNISLAGNNAIYNSDDDVWEVTVPNNVTEANSTNLIITPSAGATTNDKLATVTFADTPLSSQNVTTIPITVTAEDGTVNNNVKLKVTRTKSNIATLHTLEVVNGSFSPSFVPDDANQTVYNVTVPESATSIEINATTTDAQAEIITGTGNFALTASNQTYDIHVRSEDGNVNIHYTLKVTRTKSSDNTLKVVTVTDGTNYYDIYNYDNNAIVTPGGFGSVSHYKVTVPGNVTEVTIGALANDERATVDQTNLGTKTLTVGEKSYTIKVTSESGAPNTYTLTIEREKKSNNKLSTLKVDNVEVDGFDPEIEEYDLGEVTNDIASIVVNAEVEDSDARIVSGTGTNNLVAGNNTIRVVVKAQNGEEKTYKIKIRRAQSTDNRLSLLSVNGYSIAPAYSYIAPPAEENHEYSVTLRYSKSTFGKNDITAMPHNNTAEVLYDDDITLETGEVKQFKIKVISESGDENVYKINVTRAKSDNALLQSVAITVGDGSKNATISPVFNKETYEYEVSIPYGETRFTISGTPEVTSTVVQGNNTEYIVSEQSEVFLTTYAETYKVDGTEAERNATRTYKFTIVQSQSNNAYLSNLYVNGYGFKNPHPTFSQAYTNYDIGDIESDVTGLIINATAENANATITYRVNTGEESTNNIVTLPSGVGSGTITVTVTAPDGLTKLPYTITFNKVHGKNAYLLNLESDKGKMNPTFIKTTRDYIISVDNEVNEVNLTMYTEKRSSNVSINGNLPVSATDMRPYTYTVSDLIVGDTPVTLLVTAEDGTTALTYNVIIRKAQPSSSGDATLQTLTVDDHPYVSEGVYTTTTFAKDTTDYSIGQIAYKIDKLKVDFTTTQGESSTSMLVNGRSVAKDSDGYVSIPVEDNNNGIITVVVIAPNGSSSKTYNIHYRKKASSDAKLSNLVVSDGTLSPAFNSSTLGYEVELPEGVNNETITVTLSDPNAKLVVGGQEKNSPYVHAITGLGAGTHRASFLVTAENGTSLTYYIDIKVGSGDEKITSVTFGHTIADGMIKTVACNKTVLELKNQLDNDNAKLQVWTADETAQLNDSDTVGTGMIVKLIVNDTEKDRKTVIVKGDTNGDGEIGLLDAVLILNHYLGRDQLTGAYAEAGDVNNDADIGLLDAVLILNHYLGRDLIS